MNANTPILKAGAAVRESRQALERVKRPWYSINHPLSPILWSALVPFVMFVPRSVLPSAVGILIYFLLLIVIVCLGLRAKDQAWRRLIEIEAPELHRKISEKDESEA